MTALQRETFEQFQFEFTFSRMKKFFGPITKVKSLFTVFFPMLQGDAKTQIAFFQLCDRGPTPLLKDEATKTQVFFENDPTLRTDISTLI